MLGHFHIASPVIWVNSAPKARACFETPHVRLATFVVRVRYYNKKRVRVFNARDNGFFFFAGNNFFGRFRDPRKYVFIVTLRHAQNA